MTKPARGLLDTSVFIAAESGRPVDASRLPEESALSVVTVAELHVGVLLATDTAVRSLRLATLQATYDMTVLPVDDRVAAIWAQLRVRLAEAGRRVNVNDLWIAASAVAHDIPLVTQDADYDALGGVVGVDVVRV